MNEINIKIFCISEEISQNNLSGSNIRLVKIIKYKPQYLYFTILTVDDASRRNFFYINNSEIIRHRSNLYLYAQKFFKQRNFFKKLLWFFVNYYSTIDFIWVFPAFKKIRIEHYNGIFLQIPNITNIVYGILLKRKFQLPLIFDLRDDLINFQERVSIQYLERKMVRYADAVVCATKGSQENLRKKFPDAFDKLFYIPNGYDPDDIPSFSDRKIKQANNTVIVYTGSIYKTRLKMITYFFEGICALTNEIEDLGERIEIHFYSSNLDRKVLNVPHELSKNVFVHESLPDTNAYFDVLHNADCLLSVNMNTPYSIPGKLYEYLAVNPHVFHIDNFPITQEVLQYFPDSHYLEYGDMQGLHTALKKVIFNKQEINSKIKLPQAFIDNFSRKSIALKYAELICRMVKRTNNV
ncbi:MAG: hypothetical protein DWQ10_06145 [Calditrichaeota bacterium]|nr:MAG: hypothetical protein DWQ10_06145 [Calditrichota bacterium]